MPRLYRELLNTVAGLEARRGACFRINDLLNGLGREQLTFAQEIPNLCSDLSVERDIFIKYLSQLSALCVVAGRAQPHGVWVWLWPYNCTVQLGANIGATNVDWRPPLASMWPIAYLWCRLPINLSVSASSCNHLSFHDFQSFCLIGTRRANIPLRKRHRKKASKVSLCVFVPLQALPIDKLSNSEVAALHMGRVAFILPSDITLRISKHHYSCHLHC